MTRVRGWVNDNEKLLSTYNKVGCQSVRVGEEPIDVYLQI